MKKTKKISETHVAILDAATAIVNVLSEKNIPLILIPTVYEKVDQLIRFKTVPASYSLSCLAMKDEAMSDMTDQIYEITCPLCERSHRFVLKESDLGILKEVNPDMAESGFYVARKLVDGGENGRVNGSA